MQDTATPPRNATQQLSDRLRATIDAAPDAAERILLAGALDPALVRTAYGHESSFRSSFISFMRGKSHLGSRGLAVVATLYQRVTGPEQTTQDETTPDDPPDLAATFFRAIAAAVAAARTLGWTLHLELDTVEQARRWPAPEDGPADETAAPA